MIKHDMGNRPILRTGPWILAGVVAAALAGPAVVRVASSENWSAPAAIEWPTVGGDWGNTRYSTLSAVNAQTVSKLGGTWMKKFDDAGAGRATPVVRDGLMFESAGSWVYAHNAKTGAVVWRHQSGGSQPNGIGSVDSKKNGDAYPGREGVAVGEGLAFTGLAAPPRPRRTRSTVSNTSRLRPGDPCGRSNWVERWRLMLRRAHRKQRSHGNCLPDRFKMSAISRSPATSATWASPAATI
jgi:hypothetical protein